MSDGSIVLWSGPPVFTTRSPDQSQSPVADHVLPRSVLRLLSLAAPVGALLALTLLLACLLLSAVSSM